MCIVKVIECSSESKVKEGIESFVKDNYGKPLEPIPTDEVNILLGN
tara:strand:- start:12616 stop:12753 length:138 start_codon:yes stop_codon:yes gene_type:complete